MSTRFFPFVSPGAGGFKEFSKHWPSLCVLKEKSEKLLNAVFCDAQQQDQSQAAIENAVMNEIVPHLYLGNEMDAKNESKLEEKGIHYILNVTKNIPFYTNPANAKFVHKRIAVNDCVSQNLKQHFDEAIQFIGKRAHEASCACLTLNQAHLARPFLLQKRPSETTPKCSCTAKPVCHARPRS